jgi:hypothetical protein
MWWRTNNDLDLQNTTKKTKDRVTRKHESHKNRGCTPVLRKGKQLLLYWWHPSCYLYLRQVARYFMYNLCKLVNIILFTITITQHKYFKNGEKWNNSKYKSKLDRLCNGYRAHLEPLSCQTNDYKIRICCFSSKHTICMSKSKTD